MDGLLDFECDREAPRRWFTCDACDGSGEIVTGQWGHEPGCGHGHMMEIGRPCDWCGGQGGWIGYVEHGSTNEMDSVVLDSSEYRRLLDAEVNAEILRNALIKLSNEVLGSLPLMEQVARCEIGNTNYNILIQRAQEARDLIARTPTLTGGEQGAAT